MNKAAQLFFIFQVIASVSFAQVTISGLLVENKINPVGISEMYPRLTWQLQSPKRNVTQSAFEIRVSENLNSLQIGSDLIFHTGKIPSDQSVYVQFTGNTLKPGHKYYWQVRAWDNNDRASKWSEPGFWVMSLMEPENWTAKWIEANIRESESRPSPIFRKEFIANKQVKQAVAFITARGMYEAVINGKRVGDVCLAPGWTSYDKRLPYQTYEVTDLLQDGRNAIGITLGNGWHRGNIGVEGKSNIYGDKLALLFQMQIFYTDGTTETIISDGSWRSSTGAIQGAEIYHGETYDARLEKTGWDLPGYNDTEWQDIRLANYPVINLIATENEPIRKHEVFHPSQIITTPKGEKVIDFGQNLVGWVQVKASGKAGEQITIYHSEVLDKDGNFS